MAEACQDEADRTRWTLNSHYQRNPDSPPWPKAEREIQVWEAAAQLLRVLGTYPDESRTFVAGLLKRHKGS
ncbi:MAG: hypothetical protein P4M09_17000 [Devosia sp.]|nr:hypothetical protein [Devosia sp.]